MAIQRREGGVLRHIQLGQPVLVAVEHLEARAAGHVDRRQHVVRGVHFDDVRVSGEVELLYPAALDVEHLQIGKVLDARHVLHALRFVLRGKAAQIDCSYRRAFSVV